MTHRSEHNCRQPKIPRVGTQDRSIHVGHSRALLLVFVIAVLLRAIAVLPVLVEPDRGLRPDSPGYLDLAKGLVSGLGFTTSVEGEREACVARTPGYPAFLGLIGAGHGLRRVIPLAQLLLDLGTLLLIWRAATRLLGVRAGFAAGSIYALGLSSSVACALVMTETLFAFWIAVQIHFGARFLSRPTARDAVASAAGLGLAILTRPIGVVLIPVLGLTLALGFRRDRGTWRAVAAALAILFLTVQPWVERNRAITGHRVVASIGDFNLAAYNTAALTALVEGQSEEVARERVLSLVMSNPGNGRDWGWIPRARRLFSAELRAHPRAYLTLHVRDSLLNLVPDASTLLELWGAADGERGTKAVIHAQGLRAGARHYLEGRWGWFLLLTPWFLISASAWVIAGLGARVLWRSGRRELALLCLAAIALLVLAPGPASHPRFGVPALPWVALCAAGCFGRGETGEWIARSRWGR